MITPNGLNLLSLFKRNKEIKIREAENGIRKVNDAEKKIGLYCQNPWCGNPLIREGEGVAEVNGALVHPIRYCIEMYMSHQVLNSGKMMICSGINYMPYNTAEFLARRGKVKFSKLETGVKK